MSEPTFPPSASTTLVILLGAGAWPNSPGFQASMAFEYAAQEFRNYLLDPRGFGLTTANLLDLFDVQTSSSEQLELLGSFLEERTQALKTAKQAVRDVLVYFVGHGGFAGPSADFYLLLHRTNASSLRASGMAIDALAEVLREKARQMRRYLFLDCCFAAAAFRAFQGGPDQIAITKTLDAFAVQARSSGFPRRGTVLLCSSDQKSPSLLLPDESCTMFSYALLDVLKNGDLHRQRQLSLRDIKELVEDRLAALPEKNAPRPGLHSPDQSEGDVADIHFFPNVANMVQNFCEEGDSKYDSGQYEEALVAYRNILRWKPNHAIANSKIGDSLYALQRYDEALSAYQEALRFDPHLVNVYCQKGNILVHLKRYDKALSAYQEALSLHPQSIFIYNTIGDILSALQRYDEALVAYEHALRLDPYFPSAVNSRRKVLRTLGRNDEQLTNEQAPSSAKIITSRPSNREESEEHLYFDACIVCAIAEETKAFKRIAEQYYDVQFAQGSSKYIGDYFHATMQNIENKPFTIHVSCLPHYGPIEMALHLKPLLNEFRPRLVVMTGICAGDARRVRLGDLVVAEQAFSLDTGKMVIEENDQKRHLYETVTYGCTPGVLRFARMFDTWRSEIMKIQLPISWKQHQTPDLHI